MNIECVLHYMINIIKDCTDRTQESKLHPFLVRAKPQTPNPKTPNPKPLFYSYVWGANSTIAWDNQSSGSGSKTNDTNLQEFEMGTIE